MTTRGAVFRPRPAFVRLRSVVRVTDDAGAGTVVLQPAAEEPDPRGSVRSAAREVRSPLP